MSLTLVCIRRLGATGGADPDPAIFIDEQDAQKAFKCGMNAQAPDLALQAGCLRGKGLGLALKTARA